MLIPVAFVNVYVSMLQLLVVLFVDMLQSVLASESLTGNFLQLYRMFFHFSVKRSTNCLTTLQHTRTSLLM